ncbi:MAG: cytochrome c [Bacteroidota bacterium]
MKKIIISTIGLAVVCGSLFINGCAATKEISEKSGAQLWGENCNRCHNAPSMDQYSTDQWGIIGTHMKIRANVTDAEEQKIVAFLQNKPVN